MKEVLVIEPFCGGSHKQLVDYLLRIFAGSELKLSPFTLPAKKWHWRARTSALHFAEAVPENKKYSALFCSSVLNLAELCALRDRNLYHTLTFTELATREIDNSLTLLDPSVLL